MTPPDQVDDSSASKDETRASTSRPERPERPRKHVVAEADRRRATRACDGCRRVKEKCEGGFPCSRCLRTRRMCQFSPISAMERTLAPKGSGAGINDEAGQFERLKHLEQIAMHFLGRVSLDLPSLRRISAKLKLQKPTTPEDNGSDDNGPDELDLLEEEYTVLTLSENVAHYSGEFSHWSFSERVLKKVDESLLSEDVEVRAPIVEYYRPTQLQSPSSSIVSIADSLPPPEVAEFLVQMFFRFADPNYFYVEESWVRVHLSYLQDGSATISSSDSAWICAVLMVLAVGTQYAHLSNGPNHDDVSASSPSENDNPPELEIGVVFYHIASKLLPDVIAIASLESVQACLLLGLYTLTVDTQGIAYTYVGLAVKIAIQNGLHRKYCGPELDDHTIELRNRLWWTAYTLEKRICILHGRPGTVAIADIDAELPVENERFDDPQNSRFSNMSALIYLTIRLGDISHVIALLRRCPKRLQPTYFDRLMDIRNQLHTWWSNLPTPAARTNISPTDPLFRSHIHLKLCFHVNNIFMGRPFIFTISPKTSSRSDSGVGHTPAPSTTSPSTSPSTSSESHRLNPKLTTLVSDAVASGLTIIELCQLLDRQEGLARASYIEFSSCRAALLVLLAQSLNERTPTLRAAVETGIRLLRRCAAGNVSHRSDISIIEALDTGVKIISAERDAVAAAGATGASARVDENGYERFRSWASLWKGGPDTGDDLSGSGSGPGAGITGGDNSATPPVSSASAAAAMAHLSGLDFSSIMLSPSFDFNAPRPVPPAAAPVGGSGSTRSTSGGGVAPRIGIPPPSATTVGAEFALSNMYGSTQYVGGAEFLDDEWQWNPAGLDAFDPSFYTHPTGPPTG